jgi:hypothetical protein
MSQFTYSWISFFFFLTNTYRLDLNNDHQRSDGNECLGKSKAAFPNLVLELNPEGAKRLLARNYGPVWYSFTSSFTTSIAKQPTLCPTLWSASLKTHSHRVKHMVELQKHSSLPRS